MKTLVVALGGNALLQRGEALTAENQYRNIASAVPALARLARSYRFAIVYGNGPQVGLLALQNLAWKEVEPYPLDVLVGLCCGAGLRLAVYLRGKNAKKYRHGMEYGSARWGTAKDIEPFMAPKFADNIILTKTERLMMSNRPPDPKNARNKNVLVVGGSGSGKTRFWLKPNLLQCHSSYVVTDPKGYNEQG